MPGNPQRPLCLHVTRAWCVCCTSPSPSGTGPTTAVPPSSRPRPRCRRFQAQGPFWGRQYLFWHDGKPLTLIYEVFSTALEEFLGSSLAAGKPEAP